MENVAFSEMTFKGEREREKKEIKGSGRQTGRDKWCDIHRDKRG